MPHPVPQATVQAPPTPPAPTPGVAPEIVTNDPSVLLSNPSEVYQAARAQLTVLREQLSQLEDKRLAIARRLREGKVTGADKAGLESRLSALDQQIGVVDRAISEASSRLELAAGTPGAVAPDRQIDRAITNDMVAGGTFVMLALILPISIAFARRIWRRGQAGGSNRQLDERFVRLEQALDAVAIEVERVGESQRYMSKMLGQGAAQPIEVPERDAVRQSRL
ncbi:MAG: hypothetical protein U0163_06200 [Gemmatimonadaceae bacterium]